MSTTVTNVSLDTSTFVSPGFSADNFDNGVTANGTLMVHWRAMPCPIGLLDGDPDDIRRPHVDHGAMKQGQCSNGYLYTCAGEVYAVFQGNSKEVQMQDPGRVDGSTVQVTFTRFYNSNPAQRVRATFADRFYLKDDTVTVDTSQRLAKSATDYDMPNYEVACVQDLVDSTGKSYVQGTDFDIQNGKIHWLGTNRPSYDLAAQKGQVFTVRYTYRPFYYVKKMIHEVRLAKVQESIMADAIVEQMPQSALLIREIYFKTSDRDPLAVNPNNPRQHDAAIQYPDQYDSLVNRQRRED